MVERVERVMRIKRLRFNNDELFERRKGFEEQEQGESFASIFEWKRKKISRTNTLHPMSEHIILRSVVLRSPFFIREKLIFQW